MGDVAVQAPESSERVNSLGRIVGALVSPHATFESIVRKPTWFAPIAVTTVLALIVIGLFGHRVGWRSFFERQMENNTRVQQMSPQQQEQALEMQVKYGPPFVYVIGAISPAIVVLVIAAVLLGVFNGLAGTSLRFKTSLAITAYASSPGILRGLLGILVVLFKDPSTVDLQNLVASNAAIFLSHDSPQWLGVLLRSIDVFTFWPLVLMAIGYHAAAPKKLSTGAAFAWLFILYLVIALAATGLTAAFT
jgi:Yip1 domain